MGVIANVAERVVVMYAGYKVEEGPVREIIANPNHPYTRGLLRCVPYLTADPGPEREVLMEIPGIVPDATQIGSDCPFSPRCKHAMEQCRQMPATLEVGENHTAACWLAGGSE
jgi:oligopeptide/dipeptide ABC transporter ATP-binding protein